MKNEREVTTTRTVIESHCDICGENAGCNCLICKRDICGKCVHQKWDGDFSDDYCKPCWEIGEPFRQEMVRLENECDDAMGRVRGKWYAAAEKSIKKGKEADE